ncbi:MAG: YdcF family protein [Acetobacteraceae bacterium]
MTALAPTLARGVRRGSTARRVLVVLAVLVLAWAGGFAWFIHRAARQSPQPATADGIAVLTGGADRVRAGLRLLEDRPAARLLVSGIGGHAAFRTLARQAGVDPAPLAARVTLGRGAISTRGNADEIAAWARARGLHSLIVVTAFYHMPRALAEIGRVLPDVALYPASVSPSSAEASPRLLVEEYMKYVATELGLAGLAPSHPPVLSDALAESGV